MALRGALWVLTPSTTLPHQAKRKAEAGGDPAAMGVRPQAPWGLQRDARAAWQTWWTHWNNAKWRSWSRMSRKVSDERGHLHGQMCARQLLAISLDSGSTCLSFFWSRFLYGSIAFFLSLCYEPTRIQRRGEPVPAHRQASSAVRAY